MRPPVGGFRRQPDVAQQLEHRVAPPAARHEIVDAQRVFEDARDRRARD